MSASASGDVLVLGSEVTRFTCARPEHVLKHSEHTPLSLAIDATLESVLGRGATSAIPERSSIGVIGASRLGELRTLGGITQRFQEEGIYSIDPVVFSKANQFFTVFATCKRFDLRGPASSLFTSASHAAEIIYFATLLLRGGHATHMLALSYEEDIADGPGGDGGERQDGSISSEVCALLLGAVGPSESKAPTISACRLGPYVAAGDRRDRALAKHFQVDADPDECQLVLCNRRDRLLIEQLDGRNGARVAPRRFLDPGRYTAPLLIQLIGNPCVETLGASRGVLHVVPPDAGNVLTLKYQFS